MRLWLCALNSQKKSRSYYSVHAYVSILLGLYYSLAATVVLKHNTPNLSHNSKLLVHAHTQIHVRCCVQKNHRSSFSFFSPPSLLLLTHGIFCLFHKSTQIRILNILLLLQHHDASAFRWHSAAANLESGVPSSKRHYKNHSCFGH